MHLDVFEADVAELERTLAQAPPPPGAVAFYGSSSIRFWSSLHRDFPERPVANLGFGGSTLAACAHHFERLVPPRRPSALVVYAGDNDLGDGASPEAVLEAYRSLHRQVRDRLGPVPFAFLAIKPSPARRWIDDRIRRANELLRAAVEADARARFVDLYPRMLGPDGEPRAELFIADGLHLSRAGYRLWAEVLGPYRDFLFTSNL